MKTSELTGPALDWAVAKCEGYDLTTNWPYRQIPEYSTRWSQGGPIIEREKIDVAYAPENEGEDWYANMYWRGADCVPGYPISETFRCGGDGHTPLIAAMRCYVASKLGDEIEIPEKLK